MSRHLHGYLTRDHIDPHEFLRIARQELKRYDSVEIRDVEIAHAVCEAGAFRVTTVEGDHLHSRKLLLATGVVDKVPDIEGLRELYGRSVFHCPYCDGWEVRDTRIAIYGRGDRGSGLSLELTAWSRDLVLLSDGPCEIDPDTQARLRRNGIAIREERVARLEGADGVLQRVIFEDGEALACRALFFTTGQEQRSELATALGCEFNDKGTVMTGKYETTHLPGLYVAGDASRAVQWVVVAAAEGAEAAFSINQALIQDDLI